MTNKSCALNEDGFSLIEVLIAMGLFAIGSLAIVALYYSTSSSLRSSNDMTEAVFLAEDYLNRELLLLYRNSAPGVCTNCMAPKNITDGKYNIDISINPVNPPADSTATISIRVSWNKVLTSYANSYILQYVRAETKSTDI